MRQLTMSYQPSHAGSEGWLLKLEAIRAAVVYLGQKDVTFTLDVAKSTLSEALNEKNDKRWAAEWTCKLLAMLSRKGDDEARKLGRAILDAEAAMMPCFVIADANDEPTPEELEIFERVSAKLRARKRAA